MRWAPKHELRDNKDLKDLLKQTMRLQVKHTTCYRYSEPVSHSVNEVCLVPRATTEQICESSILDIFPVPDYLETVVDVYGNLKSHFNIETPHIECRITAQSIVSANYLDGNVERQQRVRLNKAATNHATQTNHITGHKPGHDPLHDLQQEASADSIMAQDCLLPSHFVPHSDTLDRFVHELEQKLNFNLPAAAIAADLGDYIYSNFTYDPNFSTVVTPLDAIVSSKRGVCQDFAHLAIAVLRCRNIPARYVSGYLETLPPPGQTKLRGADASHAWFSVYSADSGWTDFDPTNNRKPGNGYITTAWGRDYADVAPLRGMVTGGGTHQLSVAVDVEPVAPGTTTTFDNNPPNNRSAANEAIHMAGRQSQYGNAESNLSASPEKG